MDIGSVNSIVSTATELSQISVQSEVGTAVMRKTLDVNESQAASLIAMIDKSPSLATSGSVGTRINTTA
ncbi:YjfB family protein [Thorsellia anophelis]|uniref:Motility protein n=1 Tax=Thorsellia anophelis DSM 18579 TaxID=1123402 RepID=A0A1I0CKQ2_9GAMM|nr:YjfB family protein [Thorsellia anophelis]SET20020.1 Putative motility protein [Thorsellia anophelis DSM 18579]